MIPRYFTIAISLLAAVSLAYGDAPPPDRKAEQQRLKECGAVWQRAKAGGSRKKWQDFASRCMQAKR
jgi:hypothetical protein